MYVLNCKPILATVTIGHIIYEKSLEYSYNEVNLATKHALRYETKNPIRFSKL